MSTLRLAYSPCPNDTFIFHAWTHGLLPDAPPVVVSLHDIDELNSLAQDGEPDVVKLSFPALAGVLDRYALLHSGGALGRGAGPLVVAPATSGLATLRGSELIAGLEGVPVAIPGELTTAAMLFRLFAGEKAPTTVLRYDGIMPAVAEGRVAAGVIIHESRFTYQLHGLHCLQDLGDWWEEETGYPIPLGGIAVRRELGRDVAAATDGAVRASLARARARPQEAERYIREHAQELQAEVCREHIELYVNDFSEDYGEEGARAIFHLLDKARRLGLAPDSEAGLFWDE